ncbi:hypothetical protein EYF80_001531 [Liparis tanakae]|uniref:Uncharacterized protein n=1 Tax=Liparis tanakae TaxID=230148 RepID=A0A4Z2JDF6_9TELE|nr:hypothetical protein EYF80_001531 [Liparis tanakae]
MPGVVTSPVYGLDHTRNASQKHSRTKIRRAKNTPGKTGRHTCGAELRATNRWFGVQDILKKKGKSTANTNI